MFRLCLFRSPLPVGLQAQPAVALSAVLVLFAAAAGGLALLAQPSTVTVIAYADTRFTDPANVTATNPRARAVLIARIADENPNAVVISGDIPWHGGVVTDYVQFRTETEAWHRRHIRIIPALGNHEFSQCEPAACLENWWTAFPELRGLRWHAADLAPNVRAIMLDTMSPLIEGSEQRRWLEHQLATLPRTVEFVILSLHHPPVADIQTRVIVDHNPRPNEIALAEYLKQAALTSPARFVVVAGHVHNYERLLQDDVMYLVSGGGGAVPYEIDRTPADLYKEIDFPNYHYVKLTIALGKLKGEMLRLDEPTAPAPHFTIKDRFEMNARPVASISAR